MIVNSTKQDLNHTTTPPPLTSRPLDFLYVVYFVTHIPASLLINFQSFYPSSLTPLAIRRLPELYIQLSNDPLVGGLLGYFGDNEHLLWFKSFLLLEVVFQFPVFILGIRGLLKGTSSIYILLLIYAASTATTTLPCLALILQTPLTSAETIAKGVVSVTAEQRTLLLTSYIPYVLVPVLMVVDMAGRVLKLVSAGVRAEIDSKEK